MVKISQIVEDLVSADEVALEALKARVLNLSAYAEKIRPTIENRLLKEVRKGSIVTALSRIAGRLKNTSPLRAVIRIEDMSIKSPLSEITYEKTKEVSKKVLHLGDKFFGKGFFTSTYGVEEITLIVSGIIKKEVIDSIGLKPKGEYDNLAAVSVRFIEEQYIEVPNMIYTLISALAGKRINIIEIVSTFTEISFIVRQKDLKETIEVLKNNFMTGQ